MYPPSATAVSLVPLEEEATEYQFLLPAPVSSVHAASKMNSKERMKNFKSSDQKVFAKTYYKVQARQRESTRKQDILIPLL